MATQTLAIEQIIPVQPSDLPEGDHDGTWGGYVVDVQIQNKSYRLSVDTGIRGIDCPCVVHVQDGEVTVRAR